MNRDPTPISLQSYRSPVAIGNFFCTGGWLESVLQRQEHIETRCRVLATRDGVFELAKIDFWTLGLLARFARR